MRWAVKGSGAGRPAGNVALLAHCSQHLSDYKMIRYVAVHDGPLPRVAAGTKISKPALRKQYADAHQTMTKVR